MPDDYRDGFAAGWRAAMESANRYPDTPPPEVLRKRLAKGEPMHGKKKRKVSAYSKRYGVEYKRLKKKHPRMKFGALSKKAHAATRKAMK